MSIQQVGMSAYNDALAAFQNTQKNFNRLENTIQNPAPPQATSFADTLSSSLNEVQNLQNVKNDSIRRFASGETQNVHELMINMQKASVAVSLTSAVRNKALAAYTELSKLQF